MKGVPLLALTLVAVLGVQAGAVATAAEPRRNPAAAPATADAPDPMVRLFRSFTEEVRKNPRVKGKTIGVVPFALAKGVVTEIGLYLSDLLEVELVKATDRQFDLVTRKDLCEVIRENKLWLADRFDPRLHEKLGGLSEADFLATGRIIDRGRSLDVTVRLIETEKGRQVWADHVVVPADESLKRLVDRPAGGGGCEEVEPAPPASVSAVAAPAPSNRLEVRAWFDKTVYHLGDSLRIGVRVNRDAYLTLVNLGTSGQVSILFPNGFYPDNRVRGGQDVLIPPADGKFALQVAGPTGFDQVIAIATDEPVQFLAADFSRDALPELARAQTRSIRVGAKEQMRADPSRFAQQVIAVEIVKPVVEPAVQTP